MVLERVVPKNKTKPIASDPRFAFYIFIPLYSNTNNKQRVEGGVDQSQIHCPRVLSLHEQ